MQAVVDLVCLGISVVHLSLVGWRRSEGHSRLSHCQAYCLTWALYFLLVPTVHNAAAKAPQCSTGSRYPNCFQSVNYWRNFCLEGNVPLSRRVGTYGARVGEDYTCISVGVWAALGLLSFSEYMEYSLHDQWPTRLCECPSKQLQYHGGQSGRMVDAELHCQVHVLP